MNELYERVIRGQYPPLSKIYSEDLSYVIKCMLQVKPYTRPTCRQILAMP